MNKYIYMETISTNLLIYSKNVSPSSRWNIYQTGCLLLFTG